MKINSKNVGRIAERIAMNELEARGFHIIDLAYTSKTSANVDFIASKNGKSHNIQVKGMTNDLNTNSRWRVQYGYCTDKIIRKERPLYNGHSEAALEADVVILLAVNSPSKYRAIVMPVKAAEEAAQINISRYYRQKKRNDDPRKPGKIWVELEAPANPKKLAPEKDQEREQLLRHEDAWTSIDGVA